MTTHGHTTGPAGTYRTTPTYRTWMAMVQRCTNPKHVKFPRYGGRGITVCERWRSFEAFLADMGERPKGTTLDRVDNDLGYEPGNCRWATPKEQVARRPRASFGDWNRNKTHCPAGHPYQGENVRASKNGRKCRTCDRERAQRRRDEEREARLGAVGSCVS